LFADRLDLPFVTVPGLKEQRVPVHSFGERNWDPYWSALRAIAEFSQSNWRASINVPAPNLAETERDLQELVRMAIEQRPDALGEIFSQQGEFLSYFMTVIGAKPGSHKATYRLMLIADMIATIIAMHFKGVHDRPRPSHICPALLPPIEVPGHASYPSGHATQAHLFALLLKSILPQDKRTILAPVLEALAERIARNREIAGVHYKGDTVAGVNLAAAIHAFVMAMPKPAPSPLGSTIAAATAEWA
jgi:hypothetical protein